MQTILAVDDEEVVLQMIRCSLEQYGGFNVLLARDGKEGLRLARRKRPDLVLLDLHMPKMNGFEVLKALGTDKRTAAIPVIILTGDASPESMEQASSNYADLYLLKPFTPVELAAKVAETLALTAG